MKGTSIFDHFQSYLQTLQVPSAESENTTGQNYNFFSNETGKEERSQQMLC